MSFLNWNQVSSSLLRRRNQPTAEPAALVPQAPAQSPTNPLNHLLPQNDANGNATPRDKKTLDPLFGPNIGAVTSGPAWTASVDKKIVTDDLTPDVVTTWVEKSKDSSQPTTTLQALVNLKRPTIKLSPLHPEESDGSEQPHGLEFEYDCDAPKCGLYVHVYLPKSHPDAPPAPPHHPYGKLLVFESVVDGGFGKHLKLDEGAILELGHFEHVPPEAEQEEQDKPQPTSVASPPNDEPVVTFQEPTPTTTRQRRRFTALRFRRASNTANRSISGPALAVVDAEPQGAPEGATGTEVKKESNTSKPDDEGVKVVIRLAALDAQGTELTNINEQVTYLHIVRVGPKPARPEDTTESTEDTRPWVVKVVKREATIGPHTFHLHEIYGLTSTSSAKPPPQPASHTYPPNLPGQVVTDLDDDPQSECLLCLSSPREVLLLPCRHLVACKECALNMVEFGAGGNISQPEPTPISPAVLAGPEGGNGDGQVDGVAAAPTTTVGAIAATVNNARRKRKAKGWFCPVCRQPYSSLLRISTAPPPVDVAVKELGGDDSANANSGNSVMDALPTLGSLSIGGQPPSTQGQGILGSIRPTFLRSLTGGRVAGTELSEGVGAARRPVPLDVESTAGLGRAGA